MSERGPYPVAACAAGAVSRPRARAYMYAAAVLGAAAVALGAPAGTLAQGAEAETANQPPGNDDAAEGKIYGPDRDDEPLVTGAGFAQQRKFTAIIIPRAADPRAAEGAARVTGYVQKLVHRMGHLAWISPLPEAVRPEASDITLRERVREGRELYERLEIDAALETLRDVVADYERQLDTIEFDEPYLEALLYLGAAYTVTGNAAGAEPAFEKLAFRNPNVRLSPAIFGPPIQSAFNEALRARIAAPKAKVRILSQPLFAQVYLDGGMRGVTPFETDNLPAGTYLLRLTKFGRQAAEQRLLLKQGDNPQVNITLEPNPAVEPVTRYVETLAGQNGDGDKFAAMRGLQKELGAEKLIVGFTDNVEGTLVVDYYVADRDKPVVEKAYQAPLYDAQYARKLAHAAFNLMYNRKQGRELDVINKGGPPKPATDKPADTGPRPFYATWWFWTLAGSVGATVAVVAVLGSGG